jgi:hypothetical protein
MKNTVGLWIDHNKAVIVFLAGNDADVKLVTSDIERQRQSGLATPADDIRQRDSTRGLDSFYDEVISCIRGAEEIFILGPGEAKGGLKKRLEQSYLGRRVVGVEACDKMTDPQIVAKVREHLINRLAAAS